MGIRTQGVLFFDITGLFMNNWLKVCGIDDIPRFGARLVDSAGTRIAIFRTGNDEIFALEDKCPHKGGPLSQGIVCGRKVTCPLHAWIINLSDGMAMPPDEGATRAYETRVKDGEIFIRF